MLKQQVLSISANKKTVFCYQKAVFLYLYPMHIAVNEL